MWLASLVKRSMTNYTLRPYQTEALQRLRQAAKKKKRLLFTMPTGSGKTLLACELVKTAKEKLRSVIFLAYSKENIDQMSRKLSDYGLEHGIIKSGCRPSLMATVQVASIMTLIRREMPFSPDMILVDEAHRVTAKSYRGIVDAYPEAWDIGLTASPVAPNGKGLGDVYDDLVVGMQMQELIQLGYLVPTKVYAPSTPDLKNIGIRAGDYKEEELEKRVNKAKLVGDIVEHWQRLANGKRTVCFATTIAHSNHIVEQFKHAGIAAEHLDGETPDARRTELLERLRDGNIDIISNVGVLQESWDEPSVECMIQARPTKSLRFYIQTIGRSLRPHPNKEYALILDHAGNTLRHGFIHENWDWTLDTTKSVSKENEKKREAKGLTEWICPNCHFVNQPPGNFGVQRVCGSCGLRHVKVNGVAVKDGKLKELKAVHRKRSTDEKERVWKSCIGIAVAKNYKAGAAANIYKTKTGAWPRNLPDLQGVNWKSKAKDVWPGYLR